MGSVWGAESEAFTGWEPCMLSGWGPGAHRQALPFRLLNFPGKSGHGAGPSRRTGTRTGATSLRAREGECGFRAPPTPPPGQGHAQADSQELAPC